MFLLLQSRFLEIQDVFIDYVLCILIHNTVLVIDHMWMWDAFVVIYMADSHKSRTIG